MSRNDETNHERTWRSISRAGARVDESTPLKPYDERLDAQLDGIRIALCEIALNTAAIADQLGVGVVSRKS